MRFESTHHLVRAFVVLIVLATNYSCTMHSVPSRVDSKIPIPKKFSNTSDPGNKADNQAWWRDLQTPDIDRLVQELLAGNLDLQAGWARVQQAQALAAQASSGLWPQVGIDATATRSRVSFYVPPPIGEQSFQVSSYPMNVGAAYELDLWGRLRSMRTAGKLNADAAVEDLNALRMTLIATTVDLWCLIVEQNAQLSLLRQQLQVNQTFQELVDLRYSRGLASAVDVNQQRQQVHAIRAQIPLVEAQVSLLQHQLAVVLGKPPGAVTVDSNANLPNVDQQPTLVIPSQMLKNRPDVRAMELRIRAADHQVAAAIADRFPALRLNASTGYLDREVSGLFQNWVWSLTANIVAPIFDGGRRAAEVRRNRAVVEELVAGYGRIILTALREVEDALVREQSQARYVVELTAQLQAARTTLQHAQTRYVNGLTDYLPVLNTLRTLQQLERSQLNASRQQISNRIQLYRSLGGSWTPLQDQAANVVESSQDGSK